MTEKYMTISNKPPEKLDKDTLISIAVVLGNIKEAAKDISSAKDLMSVPVEFKANNLGDKLLSRDIASRVEQSKADALYYLKAQGAIESVAFENKSSQYDFMTTIRADAFSAFHTRVLLLVLPYIERLMMTQKIESGAKPSTPDTTPVPLPKVLYQLDGGFAIHEHNILSYMDKEIGLEAQEAKVIAAIMRRSKDGMYTSADYILAEVLTNDINSEDPKAYVRTIVSKARKAFRIATQSNRDYFKNKHSVGYIFEY